MKQILLVLPLLLILLSACGTPVTDITPVPVETELPAVPSNTEVVPEPGEAAPSPKLPAPPFDAETYLDQKTGFAFDYPRGWTVTEALVSERASQVQFLSSPEIADMATLPDGATRLSAMVYDWDPKNDLAAYGANWKTAWEASGFTILEEQELVLEQGLPAVQFTIQTSAANVVFPVTALGEQYLVLSGEGDLELVKEIVQRVRPIW
ncbi:MAG: hypothetical protein JW730_07855 [Anaerolineales bacterium]|nr:hypothetical protein [Anaerolineales bacterium]